MSGSTLIHGIHTTERMTFRLLSLFFKRTVWNGSHTQGIKPKARLIWLVWQTATSVIQWKCLRTPYKFSNVIMRYLGKNILSDSRGLAASDRHKEKKKKRKEEKHNKQNKMHTLVLDVCPGPLSWDIQAWRARAEGEHADCNERNCPWKFRTINFRKTLFH